MRFPHLKLSISLRVIGNVMHVSVTHMSAHSQFHKVERRPTQSGRDYAPRFTSSFSGTLVSLLLSPPRTSELKTCLRHANMTYRYPPRIRVCMCRLRVFCTRVPHAFLYLSPAAPLASRCIRTRVCAHVHRHRVFAEWTIDYAFASITRLRCTLSFRPISRPVPFAPDSLVEIKGDLEMRAFAE